MTIGRLLRRVRAREARSVVHHPALAGAPAGVVVTSTSFDDGGVIPLEHAGSGVGANRSPALAWSGLPAGTAQLLLVVEDVDVPLPRPLLHTVALLDPAVLGDGLAVGALVAATPGVRFVPVALGRTGYFGPRPLPGHGPHHYRFHVYAIDTPLDATPLRRARDAFDRAAGHVLAAGHLTGVLEA